ncbi:conserved hypothetical protein, partial [Ricinus communis]
HATAAPSSSSRSAIACASRNPFPGKAFCSSPTNGEQVLHKLAILTGVRLIPKAPLVHKRRAYPHILVASLWKTLGQAG